MSIGGHSKGSLVELERLAEAQATAIAELECKLNKMENEKNRFLIKQKLIQNDNSNKERELMNHLESVEFRLAQAHSLLPSKRPRSAVIPSFDDSNEELGHSIANQLQDGGFLNPATDLVYKQAYETAKCAKMKIRQSYDDLIAWKFSPDSQSGRSLMRRLRHLLSENEALGHQNQTNLLSNRESESSMQADCINEFIKTSREMNGVLEESTTDLEGLQSSIFIVKQQLNQAENLIQCLKAELELSCPNEAESLISTALASLGQINSALFEYGDDKIESPCDSSPSRDVEDKPQI